MIDLDLYARRLALIWEKQPPRFQNEARRLATDLQQTLAAQFSGALWENPPLEVRRTIDAWAERQKDGYSYPPTSKQWDAMVVVLRTAVFVADRFECVFCTTVPSDREHFIPRKYTWRGKTVATEEVRRWRDRMTNSVAACDWCNTTKAQRSGSEFADLMEMEGLASKVAGIASAWKDEQPEYAAQLQRRAEGLASFRKERLPRYLAIEDEDWTWASGRSV